MWAPRCQLYLPHRHLLGAQTDSRCASRKQKRALPAQLTRELRAMGVSYLLATTRTHGWQRNPWTSCGRKLQARRVFVLDRRWRSSTNQGAKSTRWSHWPRQRSPRPDLQPRRDFRKTSYKTRPPPIVQSIVQKNHRIRGEGGAPPLAVFRSRRRSGSNQWLGRFAATGWTCYGTSTGG
jgi:hypothetical protein